MKKLDLVLTLAAASMTIPFTVLGPPAQAAGAARVAGETHTRPPNIVLVLTDDQRVHTISRERMPHVWSVLSRRGRDYVDASVPTSLCCPSRASILTGLYAHATRVYSNSYEHGGWETFHAQGLERHTIAVALHAAGYHTGLVGKYLNGGFPKALAEGYVPPGWDTFLSFTSGVSYYDYSLNDGHGYGERPADYSTDVLAGYADRFIRTAPTGRPLFLYFAPFGPHRPFTPAPRDVDRWTGRLPSYRPPSVTEDVADKPPWVRRLSRMPQPQIDADVAHSQETLMSVDDAVGRLAKALRDTGRLHDTLFIYLSDNGLFLGEHHMREWKNLPYWWSTSIPLLMRWDGHIAPGSIDHRLALNVDLAATISRAAGLGMTTEGLDLLGKVKRSGFPLEAGSWFKADSPPHHPAYCGFRSRWWMFVQYASGYRELYDYRTDPLELRNLAHDPSFRSKLRILRRHAMARCRPVPPDFHW